MSSPFLSFDDLSALTGKKLHSAQRRVLNYMGIPHRVRPDGSLVVLWSHVDAYVINPASAATKQPEPNWGSI